ncbi:MAG: type 2 isopentenyl-diphosphate Delta-isomerase [Bacteriovoracaceae bacterium]|nr:type 2 isopentenyl-diphosphate Delta-isomerase [Bacteriovoracaceae bacterium]
MVTKIESLRKQDHLSKSLQAQVGVEKIDDRFFYEPLMAPNSCKSNKPEINFLGKKLNAPLWISSMTGGTKIAQSVNYNLAKACREFGLGMGLGSCRQLLVSDDCLADFDVRKVCGDDVPLFANLGIAQVEQLVLGNKTNKLIDLIDKLAADGLVVHLNPLQEWIQPEGDKYKQAPLETLKLLLERVNFPIIVKEVGQGMGPSSLANLLSLPIAAIEFAAFGGTNFSKLELQRVECAVEKSVKGPFCFVGHSPKEMVGFINGAIDDARLEIKCKQLIISGGISSALDGYYYIQSCKMPAIYGIAARALKFASEGYDPLAKFLSQEIDAIYLANQLLEVR